MKKTNSSNLTSKVVSGIFKIGGLHYEKIITLSCSSSCNFSYSFLIEGKRHRHPTSRRHRALDKFIENEEYSIKKSIVFSNEREVYKNGKVIYFPIYFSMF